MTPTALQTTGLPINMCILAGFPTALAKTANPTLPSLRLWFANATTLYVADEGDGYTGGTTTSTPTPLRKPPPACRSGSSTQPPTPGTSPTR